MLIWIFKKCDIQIKVNETYRNIIEVLSIKFCQNLSEDKKIFLQVVQVHRKACNMKQAKPKAKRLNII
jgi:hypothetical protein